jgi:ribosome recycling factor
MKQIANISKEDRERIANLARSNKEQESKIVIDFLYNRVIELEKRIQEIHNDYCNKIHYLKKEAGHGTE